MDEESEDDEPATRTFTPKTKACFWEGTAPMNDKEFSRCFRLTRETFKQLLNLMHPLISRFTVEKEEQEFEAHKSGRDIQAAAKVALFIRMKAAGSL